MQNRAMADIERLLGIQLPTQGRDPELLHAQQLIAIADALRERKAVAEPTVQAVISIVEPPIVDGDTNILPTVKTPVNGKRTPNPKQRA